ncbi:MAG: hypothetical protein DMF94_06315 [Acidobacteria bacterium]|nr:MAG: hypothetical protein DMF94_06315 [Acidobacteriota bacterium]
MRSSARACLLALPLAMLATMRSVDTAAPPARRSLDARDREAVLSLIKAVDLAQAVDGTSEAGLSWDSHVLKSGDHTAYVPFRVTMDGAADTSRPTAMYLRAVSRRDGVRASEERSFVRDWLLHGRAMPRNGETVLVGPGELPVGGPGIGSSRRGVADAAQASAVLSLQEREYEKQKRADEEAKKKAETRARDPFLFPFEDYYFFDLKSARTIERALALPPGEYDVYAALIDRARAKTSSPMILRRTLTIPDFWSDQLTLSSLILARDVRALKAALAGERQAEHPYTFGQLEVVPLSVASFSTGDALSVVFQMCNYGAPDSDVTAEYAFYRVDGGRRLFNRTEPQQFSDADLPPARAWETQAFVMQTVPLAPFPPGRYELEVSVRDRLTRATTTSAVAFTVVSGVR